MQRYIYRALAIVILLVVFNAPSDIAPPHPWIGEWIITQQSTRPVIDQNHPDSKGNKYGFEGGMALRVANTYHLFTSEMVGDPRWVKMRLAHWTSPDAVHWHRVATLYESSGDPRDPRTSFWSPMPIYDGQSQHWNLFYVVYQTNALINGKIWRAVSQTPGMDGIGGPYEDAGIVMEPDGNSQSWEGSQGVDSFFLYRVGNRWYALYGSHNYNPVGPWYIGSATSENLTGGWQRRPDGNPLRIEPLFIENPIITQAYDGTYLAVYDSVYPQDNYHLDGDNIGYTSSGDGIHWASGKPIRVQGYYSDHWAQDLRTPLGLIPEGGNTFTLLYTAQEKDREYWSVGMVRLEFRSVSNNHTK